MPTKSTTTRRNGEKPCREFIMVQDYARKYHGIAQDDPAGFDVFTIETMATWLFSPGSPATPYTFPYVYVTGQEYGSGKSVLGRDVFGSISHNPENITQVTGPALFRMVGDYDEDTQTVTNRFPTLIMDEIDATWYGPANESLRGASNEGYKFGATIPRVQGKTTIRYPVFCPKTFIGRDNGKLPDSVVGRSIRIDCVKHSQDELTAMGIKPMFPWKVQDEQAEICQVLSQFAKDNGMITRDYDPDPPKGWTARQWELGRTLVQLAKVCGIEKRIVAALTELFHREPKLVDARTELYTAIFEVFEDNDTTKVTTRMLLAKLRESGIGVPGGSGKGLASMLSGDGIQPTYLRIDKSDHPGYVEGKTTHRGYHRYQFDKAFVDFLPVDDDGDDD